MIRTIINWLWPEPESTLPALYTGDPKEPEPLPLPMMVGFPKPTLADRCIATLAILDDPELFKGFSMLFNTSAGWYRLPFDGEVEIASDDNNYKAILIFKGVSCGKNIAFHDTFIVGCGFRWETVKLYTCGRGDKLNIIYTFKGDSE
jgi:hypothetical protein